MPKRFIDAASDRPVLFREWRAYRGMTQGQVEGLLEWRSSRLSKLESGTHAWTGDVLTALARVYACEVEDLFELPPQLPQPFAPPVVAEIVRGGGIAGIAEMHRLITRLQFEIADLKKSFIPRLQTLEDRLAEAGAISESAVKDAEELARLFARFASKLPAPTARRRSRKTAAGKISA
jgi:transcriptional regulator with XRE-family HTH domain